LPAYEYISKETFIVFSEQNEEVEKLVNYMIRNPNKFGVKTNDD
jgi:hypothetical protein